MTTIGGFTFFPSSCASGNKIAVVPVQTGAVHLIVLTVGHNTEKLFKI